MKHITITLIPAFLALALPATVFAKPGNNPPSRTAKVEIIESVPGEPAKTVTLSFIMKAKKHASVELEDGTTSYEVGLTLNGQGKHGIDFALELDRGTGARYETETDLESSGTIKLGTRTVVSRLTHPGGSLVVALTLQ